MALRRRRSSKTDAATRTVFALQFASCDSAPDRAGMSESMVRGTVGRLCGEWARVAGLRPGVLLIKCARTVLLGAHTTQWAVIKITSKRYSIVPSSMCTHAGGLICRLPFLKHAFCSLATAFRHTALASARPLEPRSSGAPVVLAATVGRRG